MSDIFLFFLGKSWVNGIITGLRFSFFLGFDLFPDSVFVQLHQDENQSPGEIINEWQIILRKQMLRFQIII